MSIQTVAFVLSEHNDLAVATVGDVREYEIDQAICAAKGYSRPARSAVSGLRRFPSPPARTIARTCILRPFWRRSRQAIVRRRYITDEINKRINRTT